VVRTNSSFICGLWILFYAFILVGCSSPTEEKITDYKRGEFKIEVRSQEFHHSSIRNVDICVAEIENQGFPGDKSQCFLHGFDFSGLSVSWLSDQEIQIKFDCGRVTSFTNFALISKNRSVPVEFHAMLNESCNRI